MSKHKSTAEKFDEAAEQFRTIHDGLPESVASMDAYDIEGETFDEEWIVGSSVTANIVTRSGPLSNALKEAAAVNDVSFEKKEYMMLETRDVDAVSTDNLKIPTETFENVIEWYVSQQDDMVLVDGDTDESE